MNRNVSLAEYDGNFLTLIITSERQMSDPLSETKLMFRSSGKIAKSHESVEKLLATIVKRLENLWKIHEKLITKQ